jgi:hypothetical protein
MRGPRSHCTYKQAQRGRKPGYIVKAASERKGKASHHTLPFQIGSTSRGHSPAPSSSALDAQAIPSSPEPGHGTAGLSTDAYGAVEIGSSTPFFNQVLDPHHIHRRSSSDPPATHFSLSRIVERGAKSASAADGHTAESLATAFGGVRAPEFGSLPSSWRFGDIQDPLASGLLIEFEVEALFAL